MIVTSKKCFLNVLTQICDADTLLNANYYIADVRSPDGSVQLSDSMKYNEYGQLVHAVEPASPYSLSPSIGRYNIHYGSGELDPSIYITNTLVGLGEAYDNPVERFVKHLNATDTFLSVYDYLFSKSLKGNGLQILIYCDEEAVTGPYVDLACQYLAQNFGSDISFIDPQYRPNVQGSVEYVGNKVLAKKVIDDIRDTKYVINFQQAVSSSGCDACINNLQVYLNQFDVHQMIYLYNLLFPDAPLPPDNYTQDHVKQIIIGRVSSQIPKNPYTNIAMTEDYAELLRQYDIDVDDADDLF